MYILEKDILYTLSKNFRLKLTIKKFRGIVIHNYFDKSA